MTTHCKSNSKLSEQQLGYKDATVSTFPAYKPDPVMLQAFVPKLTIMHSKEKPKKIGIVGSNGAHYNFLLKCDKYGDLRKE